MTAVKTWRRELMFPHDHGFELGGVMISRLLGEFDAFASSVDGLGAEAAHDLRLVVDELAANVVRHVSEERDAVLHVEIEAGGEGVLLRVRDDGPAFDPFKQSDPYLGSDLDRRRVGGVGLYFLRTLFPDGKYSRGDGWNVSEVRRRLKKGD